MASAPTLRAVDRRRPGSLAPQELTDEWRRTNERDAARVERSEKHHPRLIRRPELGELEAQWPGRVAQGSPEFVDGFVLQPACQSHDLDPRLLANRYAEGHGRRSRAASDDPPMILIGCDTRNREGKISAPASWGPSFGEFRLSWRRLWGCGHADTSDASPLKHSRLFVSIHEISEF